MCEKTNRDKKKSIIHTEKGGSLTHTQTHASASSEHSFRARVRRFPNESGTRAENATRGILCALTNIRDGTQNKSTHSQSHTKESDLAVVGKRSLSLFSLHQTPEEIERDQPTNRGIRKKDTHIYVKYYATYHSPNFRFAAAQKIGCA